MNALEIHGLTKRYPSFTLNRVSFTLPQGEITGFIGRNGAGKSTTLRCISGLTVADEGEIRIFDQPLLGAEDALKMQMGFVNGGADFYKTIPIHKIAAVTKRFYPDWQDADWQRYMQRFHLDEKKTPGQLSAGMKVKLAIALALSHRAKLLLLDEPTSGLDPVSREELSEEFLRLKDEGTTLLFSTHITDDLESVADRIVYIRNGEIFAENRLDDFMAKYRICQGDTAELFADSKGVRRNKNGYTGLYLAADAPDGRPATLAEIISHLEGAEL